ncbi:30S ribosomal protein S19e [Candidatus Woesearchaeota archaeon]|nr:30S ribosomal protein S19e [Candidatus Woesearchaeota archaeon]
MPTMHDVPINDLIIKLAAELKQYNEINPPEWANYAKTGAHKERPPTQADWWHIRSAAILRSIAVLGPVGVSKLRQKYGGRKNRGTQPETTVKGSGNIIRKILQQLQEAKLVDYKDKTKRKGRMISPKGQSLIDKTAQQIYTKHSPAKKAVEKTAQKPVKEAKKEEKAEVKTESKEPAKKEVKL